MSSKLPLIEEDETKLQQALLEHLASRLGNHFTTLEQSNRRVLEESASAAVESTLARIEALASAAKVGRNAITPETLRVNFENIQSQIVEMRREIQTSSQAAVSEFRKVLDGTGHRNLIVKAVGDALDSSSQLKAISGDISASLQKRQGVSSSAPVELRTLMQAAIDELLTRVKNQSTPVNTLLPSNDVAAATTTPENVDSPTDKVDEAFTLWQTRAQIELESFQKKNAAELHDVAKKALAAFGKIGEPGRSRKAQWNQLTSVFAQAVRSGTFKPAEKMPLEELTECLKKIGDPPDSRNSVGESHVTTLIYTAIAGLVAGGMLGAYVSRAIQHSDAPGDTKTLSSTTSCNAATPPVSPVVAPSKLTCINNDVFVDLFAKDTRPGPTALARLVQRDLGAKDPDGKFGKDSLVLLKSRPAESNITRCRDSMSPPMNDVQIATLLGATDEVLKSNPLRPTHEIANAEIRKILDACFPPRAGGGQK